MDFSKNVEKELGSFETNKKGDILKIKSVTDEKGNVKYDIRMFYTNDSGEVLPTKKGVRLSDEMVADMIMVLLKNISLEALIDISATVETLMGDSEYEEEGSED